MRYCVCVVTEYGEFFGGDGSWSMAASGGQTLQEVKMSVDVETVSKCCERHQRAMMRIFVHPAVTCLRNFLSAERALLWNLFAWYGTSSREWKNLGWQN